MPSICTTRRSSPERSVAIQVFMRSVDNATKCREAADFDTPAPAGAGTSPSGSRTARPNFRVETLMSMRFIAHRPSQSSAAAPSQLGSEISWPPSRRTRGRSTSTRPPWKPILPCVRPQRYPRRPSLRACRGPQSSSASFSIIAPNASIPAVKQKRSKLADTSSQAFPTAPTFVGGKAVSVVLFLFMALLSFRGISTPSLPAQGEQRRFSFLAFQHFPGHPRWSEPPPYIIRDRDGAYGDAFIRRLTATGTRDHLISARASPKGRSDPSAASAATISSCLAWPIRAALTPASQHGDASYHIRSWADYTTNTPESEFLIYTGPIRTTRQRKLLNGFQMDFPRLRTNVCKQIVAGRTRARTLDPLIKSQVATRRHKDLAVKYLRIGAFDLNGLRADRKMNCWALGRFRFARSDRSSRSPRGVNGGQPASNLGPHTLRFCYRFDFLAIRARSRTSATSLRRCTPV
jgi:hypothetical protein